MLKRNRVKELSLLILLMIGSLLLLSGCAKKNSTLAPVQEAWQQSLKTTATYTVQPGDTLFSIAWAYGLDYRQVASVNGLTPPAYHITNGQKLKLLPSGKTLKNNATAVRPAPVQPSSVQQKPIIAPAPSQTTPLATPTPKQSSTVNASNCQTKPKEVVSESTVSTNASVATSPVIAVRSVTKAGIQWGWPVKGRLIKNFAAGDLCKGIDIAGKAGTPVLAAASGKVVYAGNGLRGYGELLILKHNDEFLSAYAHNQKLLVSEGQTVRIGQEIARMGNTESKQVMLHFEIRRAGKPVDPVKFLP